MPSQHEGNRRRSSRSCSPLIHQYRLASSDTSHRSASVLSPNRRRSPRNVRSVSFENDMIASQPVNVSSEPPFDRQAEYKTFLSIINPVTFFVTLVLPAVLHRYLAQCSEPQCYTVALQVRSSVESSVPPCRDFFQYACGGIKSPIVDKVQSGLRKSTIRWVSTVPATPKQSALQKSAILLRNCIKLANRKPEDIDKIKMVLNATWLAFPRMPDVSTFKVIKSLVALNLEWGIAVLFRLTVGQNLQKRSEHIFYVLPNDQLAEWVTYLDALEEDRNLDVYVRRCAEIIGENGMSYSRLVDAMRRVNQEARLALRAGSRGEAYVSYVPFHTRDVLWSDVFGILAKESLPNVSRELFVIDTDHFEAVTLFVKSDPTALYAYVGLYVVWYLAMSASHSLAYSTRVRSYEYRLSDIWAHCFADVRRFMPHALLYAYAERHFSTDDVRDIQDMLRQVIRVTSRMLGQLAKERAINVTQMAKKVGSLRLFLFRPPYMTRSEDLNRLYSYLPDQKDEEYIDAFLSASRRTAQYARSLLHYGVRSGVDVFFPPFVDHLPYMASVYGMLDLPLSYLLPPVYTFGQSLSLSYAGLGHEISLQVSRILFGGHRMLNASGHYEVVWSPSFRHELQRKVQCLRKQFLSYSWDESDLDVTSMHLALAMHITYRAFTEAVKQTWAAPQLLAERRLFALSPQQLFFLGSCIKWCEMEHSQALQQKCRFPLMVLKAFARTFACSQRDRMTSEDDCFFHQDEGA